MRLAASALRSTTPQIRSLWSYWSQSWMQPRTIRSSLPSAFQPFLILAAPLFARPPYARWPAPDPAPRRLQPPPPLPPPRGGAERALRPRVQPPPTTLPQPRGGVVRALRLRVQPPPPPPTQPRGGVVCAPATAKMRGGALSDPAALGLGFVRVLVPGPEFGFGRCLVTAPAPGPGPSPCSARAAASN